MMSPVACAGSVTRCVRHALGALGLVLALGLSLPHDPFVQ
jgi:hypothetical protein